MILELWNVPEMREKFLMGLLSLILGMWVIVRLLNKVDRSPWGSEALQSVGFMVLVIGLSTALIEVIFKELGKPIRVHAQQYSSIWLERQAVRDSVTHTKKFDLKRTSDRVLRDSVSRTLTSLVKATYPRVATGIKWVVLEKENSAYAGRFYSDRHNSTIGIMVTDNMENLHGTLSHEVGHLLEPSNQKWMADTLPKERRDSLDQYEKRFRDLYHRENSLVYSGNWFLTQLSGNLRKGRLSEEAFLSQYIAELLGCYYSYCSGRGGGMSPEETALAREYTEYLQGGSFSRREFFEARRRGIRTLESSLRKLKNLR